MDSPLHQDSTGNNPNDSLLSRYRRAIALVESNPGAAVDQLRTLQEQVAQRHILPSPNESCHDTATLSLELLPLEHYLAIAWINIPQTSPPPGPHQSSSPIEDTRQSHLQSAADLFVAFLQRLERLELLSHFEKQQIEEWIEALGQFSEESSSSSSLAESPGITPSRWSLPPLVNRDVKIARYRAQQEALHEQQRLQSLLERRSRLEIADVDELDGYDLDSLQRSLALKRIEITKLQAFEELSNILRELPMIAMRIQAVQQQQLQHGRYNSSRSEFSPASSHSETVFPPSMTIPTATAARTRSPNSDRQSPSLVTYITKDATSGQLHIQREVIRSGVLRMGWNQPTMTLDELAEREVRDAMDREGKQKAAEDATKQGPRRYEYLQRDGLEDSLDLVDASARLDRSWDDWKDENPRGSGNKRGDVGDRNI